jgi:hypothetical protein
VEIMESIYLPGLFILGYFSWALSSDLTAEVTQKVLELYTLNLQTKLGQKLPIAIPINSKMKEMISKGTGLDTTLLPPVLPLNIQKTDITTITKSKTPVLTEQTWDVFYNYLNENLNRFQRRHFEEFSYLKVVPKTWQIIMLYIFALAIAIGINIWTFLNEFEDQKPSGYKGYKYNNSWNNLKNKFKRR